MFSQRGVLNLGHSLQDMREHQAPRSREPLEPASTARCGAAAGQAAGSDHQRFNHCALSGPGASFQPRAGIARHDAVAWGFARATDAYGVDIIQQCESLPIRRDGARVVGGTPRAGPSRRARSG